MHGEHETCGEIEASLALYVGGDLEVELAERVRAHLRACAECAGRARAAQTARRALRAGLEAHAGKAFGVWPRVAGAIAQHEASIQNPLPVVAAPPRRRLATLAWAAGIAATLALALWGARIALREDAPAPSETPEIVEVPKETLPLAGPTIFPVSAPTETLIAQPAQPEGLRRLQPGEARLREGAVPIYYADGWLNGLPPDPSAAEVRPAGLQRR